MDGHGPHDADRLTCRRSTRQSPQIKHQQTRLRKSQPWIWRKLHWAGLIGGLPGRIWGSARSDQPDPGNHSVHQRTRI
uniref:Uncharacterized protein n=1 Tax=Arundo donax TaxID=35708 RepID=A0A0A9GTX4_ARUDO